MFLPFVEIDFESILGQLSSLDDQFNCFGENEAAVSKSILPESPKVTDKVAAKSFNAAVSRDTTVADDFGDINSLLMNAIFELNQLASDDVTQPSSTEIKKVGIPPTVEIGQRPVVPGSSIDTPHLPQPPDAKKPLAEKSQKPPSAVRASAKSDVVNRGETVSLKSTDSNSSSLTQLGNSCHSSGPSNAASLRTLPQVLVRYYVCN